MEDEFDKISALAAPPGHSLTDEPGKWAWERPPQYANPDEALDFVLDKLEEPARREDIMRMLVAGISIQELVAQIAFKGFMQGAYTPDVAELIKPSIAIYLYREALEEGFEPRLMVDPDEEEGNQKGEIDEQAFFSIMKERNPDLFEAMNEQINREYRIELEEESGGSPEEMQAMQAMATTRQNPQSFLNVEGV
jgi:hypothetical protein